MVINLRCRVRQFPVLEWIIILISFNIPARDLHEGQGGARLLFHWDLIWVNFVPVNRSPKIVIASVTAKNTL